MSGRTSIKYTGSLASALYRANKGLGEVLAHNQEGVNKDFLRPDQATALLAAAATIAWLKSERKSKTIVIV